MESAKSRLMSALFHLETILTGEAIDLFRMGERTAPGISCSLPVVARWPAIAYLNTLMIQKPMAPPHWRASSRLGIMLR